MPRRRKSAGVSEEQIRNLSLRFAADIVRLVRTGIAEEVASQVGSVLDGITRSGGSVRLSAGGVGDRRLGKTPVPVQCPVPGCRNPGIRAKRNFCAEHAAGLSDNEKEKLRQQQLASRKGGASSTGTRGGRRAAAAKKGRREKKG